jgi:hypothetical protein
MMRVMMDYGQNAAVMVRPGGRRRHDGQAGGCDNKSGQDFHLVLSGGTSLLLSRRHAAACLAGDN